MGNYSDYFFVKENMALNTQFLKVIKDIIIEHFENLGIKFDYNKRDIICDKRFPCPMFCRADENEGMKYDTLYVNDDCKYWCKIVFQLSHEITHCFIHCANSDRTKHIDWIEETICEAVSLYFLKYFSEKWPLLPLYELDPNYAIEYDKYLNNELSKEGNKQLTLCSSIEELKQLNATSQEERENRRYERDRLFNLLTSENILALISYRDFAVDNLLLDTVKYRQEYVNNPAVSYLCTLQDKIVGLNKV